MASINTLRTINICSYICEQIERYSMSKYNFPSKYLIFLCNRPLLASVGPVNSINTGTITPGKSLCLGETKMTTTTINVVNSFGTIFSSYLLFFKNMTLQRKLRYKFINHNFTFKIKMKTLSLGTLPDRWCQPR